MTSTRKTGLSPEPGPESNDDRFVTALARARRLCASREYCISDIRSRLEAWDLVPPEKREQIIASLISDRFIDEERYASAFARDRLRYNKWGRIKISWALKGKGLPADIVAGALASIDGEEYLSVASRLVKSLKKSSKKRDSRTLTAFVVRSMQSRGFETAVTLKLLKSDDQNSDPSM